MPPLEPLRELVRTARAGERLSVPGPVVEALVGDARSLIHRLLRDVTHRPDELEGVLDPMFNVAGNELYLDRAAGLCIKTAHGQPATFATVASATFLVHLHGGPMTVECFAVDQLRANFVSTQRIAPGQGILCADPGHAYRFSAPGPAALLAKWQPERDRPLRDYQHVFTLAQGSSPAYQATVPFDLGAYRAAYQLSMAHSLGQLESLMAGHKDKLLAGPTPFLWEAAKLFIRARDSTCYDFLDAVIARQNDNFSPSARMTRSNIAEFIPRAN